MVFAVALAERNRETGKSRIVCFKRNELEIVRENYRV